MTNKSISVYMPPHAFWTLKVSGVSRYVCELTQQLLSKRVQVHIPIKNTPNENLKTAPFFSVTSKEEPTASLFWSILSHLFSLTKYREKFRRQVKRDQAMRYMRKHTFDIIHPTHNNAIEILPYIHDTPLVITVHDMTHELFPSSFASNDPSSKRKKMFVEKADRIIAITECTKNDLIRLFNVSPEKIDVIHHGNSLTLPSDHNQINLSCPQRYVLFVGKRQGYKNFTRFVKSFAIIAKNDPTLELVCAGGGKFTSEEREFLKSLGVEHRTHQKWVTDTELAILYNRSLCFVYPSEYEGFGLPILEAFECKTPVLCANSSCFPEVAGKAALYFSPHDEKEMAQRISEVINNKMLRKSLIQAGKERLKNFSWEKCAELTLLTYQKAISKKN